MFSFVVPAYNEEQIIAATIQEILQAIASVPEIEGAAEVIIVDDHSEDSTFDVVSRLGDSRVFCIRLSKRSGSHVALRAGLALAKGKAACCLSADGQDDPNAVPKMIEAWKKGNHIVWALRRSRENEPIRIKLLALFFYRMLQFMSSGQSEGIDLSRADFYLLDRKVIDAVNQSPERNTSLFGLIAWSGFKQSFVEYDRRNRQAGGSKWTFRSRIRLALDWMVSFSGVPLKLMVMLGFGISGLGFVYAAFVFYRALFFGTPAVGWPMVVILILVLGGIQLITLGVLGEYLWRTFDETKRRPLYFIECTTKEEEPIGHREAPLKKIQKFKTP